MKSLTILGVALAATSSACAIPPERGHLNTAASSTPTAHTESVTVEPVLYARDGTPVGSTVSAPYARDAALADPAHGVQRSEGSRMYLLELYQEVVDTKESLELEVRSLMIELQRTQDEATTLSQELESSQARVAELESTTTEYRASLREMAARLVTAQIRRLESEKLLLESKVDWARTRRVIESASHREAPEGGANR